MLIEDRCPTLNGVKLTEVINLDVVNNTDDCGPGEWCVSANQLVSQLQMSCAAIEGKLISLCCTCLFMP